MEYCGPLGIPHSVFLRWNPDDQDKALAHAMHKRTVCGKCGTNPDDWLDRETGEELEDQPYELASRYCPGCATLEAARKDVPKERQSLVTLYLVKAGGRRVRGNRRSRSDS
jgi:ribosomal protein S27AE